MDPIPARAGSDGRPQFSRLRGSRRESFSQIGWHFWFRFFCCRSDLNRENVACVCARGLTQSFLYFEPMTFLAVWLERSLERETIDDAFDRRHATRGELCTGVLWQHEKCPVFLGTFRGPEEFRFETNLTSNLGHVS